MTFESKQLGLKSRQVKNIVGGALKYIDAEIAAPEIDEVHVLITNDVKIKELNSRFRGKNKATDVLSFPQFRREELTKRTGAAALGGTYLGDLVISTDTTIRQAKEFGVRVQEEFLRLVVHGVLHLCGYDHEGVPRSEAARMRRRERSIYALLCDALD